jgi:hypothetical protein
MSSQMTSQICCHLALALLAKLLLVLSFGLYLTLSSEVTQEASFYLFYENFI